MFLLLRSNSRCFTWSETLANVANAVNQPLVFPSGFSATASDLIKRLLASVRVVYIIVSGLNGNDDLMSAIS